MAWELVSAGGLLLCSLAWRWMQARQRAKKERIAAETWRHGDPMDLPGFVHADTSAEYSSDSDDDSVEIGWGGGD